MYISNTKKGKTEKIFKLNSYFNFKSRKPLNILRISVLTSLYFAELNND